MRGVFGTADNVGRTPQQLRHRHRLVGSERDKGRVGAILQQSPHQIGQQIAVAADRRVGAMGDVGAVFAELRIERLAHAVQALEFESARFAFRQFEDGPDRQRIMGGELRKDPRPQRQQLLRAGDVVQIRHRLAGEYRIAVKPALLRALDLGVPIGALHQPHYHFAVEAASETVDVVDHVGGTLLIGLDREAKAVPASQRWIAEGSRYHVERQFQPVRFLGIDSEIQIKGFSLPREFDQARDQFRVITRSRLTASKRGCNAESLTEMPGRASRDRSSAARPIASIAPA